jgi:hypothetical protein
MKLQWEELLAIALLHWDDFQRKINACVQATSLFCTLLQARGDIL